MLGYWVGLMPNKWVLNRKTGEGWLMWQLVGICNMIIRGGSKRGNIHSEILLEFVRRFSLW